MRGVPAGCRGRPVLFVGLRGAAVGQHVDVPIIIIAQLLRLV